MYVEREVVGTLNFMDVVPCDPTGILIPSSPNSMSPVAVGAKAATAPVVAMVIVPETAVKATAASITTVAPTTTLSVDVSLTAPRSLLGKYVFSVPEPAGMMLKLLP